MHWLKVKQLCPKNFQYTFCKSSCKVLISPDDPLQHDQHGLREQPGRLGHLRVPILAASGGSPDRPGVAPLQPRAQGHADTPLRGGFVIELSSAVKILDVLLTALKFIVIELMDIMHF